jgi:hypothetical protein
VKATAAAAAPSTAAATNTRINWDVSVYHSLRNSLPWTSHVTPLWTAL